MLYLLIFVGLYLVYMAVKGSFNYLNYCYFNKRSYLYSRLMNPSLEILNTYVAGADDFAKKHESYQTRATLFEVAGSTWLVKQVDVLMVIIVVMFVWTIFCKFQSLLNMITRRRRQESNDLSIQKIATESQWLIFCNILNYMVAFIIGVLLIIFSLKRLIN